MTQQQEQTPLFGDKALELFFAGNPAPVATAMWATAMRNSYEERLAAAHLEVERLRAKIAYYEAPLPMGEEGYEAPLPMGEGGVYTITTDHRFTDAGICVRCGQDAEGWDAGCVEAIVNAVVKARAELAEVERLRTMCQLWKAAAKRKRQHHDNALAALAHNIKVNNAQGQEIKRLHRQLEDAQVARRYVPVEDGHYPLTFVQLTIADNNDGRKYISIWDEEFDRQVGCALPDDWAVCRLAPQQDERENDAQ